MTISADLPIDPQSGRCYHTGCASGDVAPYILLTGDPARAEKVATRFDSCMTIKKRAYREFLTLTGTYRGTPLSVTATGIGCDNTDICVQEHTAIVDNPTFIRIGSCGSPRDDFNIGDLVISSKAIPHENTCRNYRHVPRVPHADPVVLEALIQAAAAIGSPYHVGTTISTSSFYGGQGRRTPGFHLTEAQEHFVERALQKGALNIEMEMSTLLALANCYRSEKIPPDRIRAGGVCAIYAIRSGSNARFGDPAERAYAEEKCIVTGLGAIERLAIIDGKKP